MVRGSGDKEGAVRGRVVSCVRRGFVRGVSLGRFNRRFRLSRGCVSQCFGRRFRVALSRCVARLQLRRTGRLLRSASAPIARVTVRDKCRGMDCFVEDFGGACKVSPLGCEGGWTNCVIEGREVSR